MVYKGALNRAKQKYNERFDELTAPLMEAGEQRVAGTYAKSGPSPWLLGGLLGYFTGQHWYFIEVTDRRVLFVRDVRNPAKRLAWADPRDSVKIHDAHWTDLWSKFWYRRPDGQDIRINVQ